MATAKYIVGRLLKEQREVTQLQYISWPDHGVPTTTTNMVYLHKMVEEMHDKTNPIIVHCRYLFGFEAHKDYVHLQKHNYGVWTH